MGEFKIGDSARVLTGYDDRCHCFPVGTIVEVIEIDDQYGFINCKGERVLDGESIGIGEQMIREYQLVKVK